MKKDTVALWYKDGREVKVNEKLDFSEGVLTLEITQVRRILLMQRKLFGVETIFALKCLANFTSNGKLH